MSNSQFTYLKSKGDEDIGLRARVRVQKSKVSIYAKTCQIIFEHKWTCLIIYLYMCRFRDRISKPSLRLCLGKESVNWYASPVSLTADKHFFLVF